MNQSAAGVPASGGDGSTVSIDIPAGDIRDDSRIGTILNGRFRIERLAAYGGVARVYRAEQLTLRRPVAIKVFHPRCNRGESLRDHLLNEAACVAKLKHPNTVKVFDYGCTADGSPYIAMEWIEGRTLQDLLIEIPVLSVRRTVQIATEICDALSEAHALGMVHRDLKPSNVMLCRTGGRMRESVKVADFGLVQSVAEPDPEKLEGMVVGSPGYMAPEQIRGQALDCRADVYALGVLLYRMLAGEPPFHSGDPVADLHAHLNDPIPPLRLARQRHGGGGLPEQLELVVLSCLLKDRSERIASMKEVHAALEPFANAVSAMQGATRYEPESGQAQGERGQAQRSGRTESYISVKTARPREIEGAAPAGRVQRERPDDSRTVPDTAVLADTEADAFDSTPRPARPRANEAVPPPEDEVRRSSSRTLGTVALLAVFAAGVPLGASLLALLAERFGPSALNAATPVPSARSAGTVPALAQPPERAVAQRSEQPPGGAATPESKQVGGAVLGHPTSTRTTKRSRPSRSPATLAARPRGAHKAGAHKAGAREAGAREAGARKAGARKAGAHKVVQPRRALATSKPARDSRARDPGAKDSIAKDSIAKDSIARAAPLAAAASTPARLEADELAEKGQMEAHDRAFSALISELAIEARKRGARSDAIGRRGPEPTGSRGRGGLKITELGSNAAVPRSVLTRALGRISPALEGCYRKSRGTAPPSELKVKLQIGQAGRVESTSLDGNASPALRACLERPLGRLVTRTRPDTGTLRASFTLRYD
ncbi:MAG: protein kinase [Proteobacteria bacterium]|nr:protein kinase [Pseudomonadota bacterium]